MTAERPSDVVLSSPASIQLSNDGESELLLGYQTVRLNKLFGPLIFADIRIHADPETCEWVIERQCGDEWREFVRIPGQLDGDFPEETL